MRRNKTSEAGTISVKVGKLIAETRAQQLLKRPLFPSIERVSSAKILGVTFPANLSPEQHINNIIAVLQAQCAA